MTNVLRTTETAWTDYKKEPGFGCDLISLHSFPLVTLGVSLEQLPPGNAICPLHYHMVEEEHLYVLEGTLTVRELLPDGTHRTFDVHDGELIAWPGGTRIAHQTQNRGDRPARFLAISDTCPQEVAFYPDSGKVLLRGAGIGVFTERGKTALPLDGHFAAARAATAHPATPVADDARPPHVAGPAQVPERALGLGGFGRPLARAAGAQSVFVNVDRLPPGARTSDLHAHLADEELVYVLSGHPTLRQIRGRREGRTPVFDAAAERVPLSPGDAVHWAPGDLVAHQILNETSEDTHLLVIGTDCARDIVLFPERGEIYAAVIDTLGSLGHTDYFAGESR